MTTPVGVLPAPHHLDARADAVVGEHVGEPVGGPPSSAHVSVRTSVRAGRRSRRACRAGLRRTGQDVGHTAAFVARGRRVGHAGGRWLHAPSTASTNCARSSASTSATATGSRSPRTGQPVRRRHRRPPVDPRRRRAGQGRAVRRADRPRLPHAVARPAARRPGLARRRASRWASTTASTSCASRPRCPVGSKLRLGVKLLEVTDIAGGVQVKMEFTFEVEGAAKPSCVAEVLFRLYT